MTKWLLPTPAQPALGNRLSMDELLELVTRHVGRTGLVVSKSLPFGKRLEIEAIFELAPGKPALGIAIVFLRKS
jgi:hypothetical protein